MRQSSSTTMFAPTGIDDSKHYVLMSDELAEKVDLVDKGKRKVEIWSVDVVVSGQAMKLPLQSIEDDSDGKFIVCIQVDNLMEFFTSLLLNSSSFAISILGSSFNSRIVKLESGRAYLRLLR